MTSSISAPAAGTRPGAAPETDANANANAKADVTGMMHDMGLRARAASGALARASTKAKDAALLAAAMTLRADAGDIAEANARDMASARSHATAAEMDRLRLDDDRIAAMALALEGVAALADPVGAVIAQWSRPNGLVIERVRTPLGVIGVIYESRPNVTADAGALCLKSGNAVILRAGSSSFHTCRAICACLVAGVDAAGLPEAAIQMTPTTDRSAVGLMLAGLDGAIDVIVPRGGRALTTRVQAEARVPVLGHLEGCCHVYVDSGANLDMARDIVLNAKLRRTGICSAAETLLVDRACAATHLAPLVASLLEAGCAVRGDAAALAADPRVAPAQPDDWAREYLDAVITVGTVDGVAGAADHIRRHGSGHTEAIITADAAAVDYFFSHVDSAVVLHNASTQFADGGEFGMGAEIGVATGKLHARGPVGLEQLTGFKYLVRGGGQTRP